MVLLVVLAVFWIVAFAMSKLFTRFGSPTGAEVATPAPAEAAAPVVHLETVPTTWSELDDRQLTRLLKSAAP